MGRYNRLEPRQQVFLEKVRGGSKLEEASRFRQRVDMRKDMNTVLRIITRADEEGDRLRSTAPFCGILTQREVKAIWARYDQE